MNLEHVKALREKTGAGVVEAKKALEEAGDDMEQAVRILRERGQAKALKKTDRTAGEGVVAQYLHSNRKIASMVKLYCETDFVARTDDFQELARDIAMHVAALDPKYLRPEDVPGALVATEREYWVNELKEQGKPENLHDKILEGKEKKFREELALLTQAFVKDPERTVGALVTEKIAKIGENIQVGDFVRYSL